MRFLIRELLYALSTLLWRHSRRYRRMKMRRAIRLMTTPL